MYLSIRLILFNKRRSGEASRAKVEDFIGRVSYSDVEGEEVSSSLTPFERDIARALTLMKIIGKAYHVVPMLLTEDLVTVTFCTAFMNEIITY